MLTVIKLRNNFVLMFIYIIRCVLLLFFFFGKGNILSRNFSLLKFVRYGYKYISDVYDFEICLNLKYLIMKKLITVDSF